MEYHRISDANLITAQYMDKILIKERLIDSVVADTQAEFFGDTEDYVNTELYHHFLGGCVHEHH